MKRLIALLLALLMTVSLAACGGVGVGEPATPASGGEPATPDDVGEPAPPEGGGEPAAPPEGYDASFTIYVDRSDKWAPFEDGGNITFENSSKGSVISHMNDGDKVTFFGVSPGKAEITAIYGDKTAKALVTVIENPLEDEDEEDDEVMVPLITAMPDPLTFFIRFESDDGDDIFCQVLTETSYSFNYREEGDIASETHTPTNWYGQLHGEWWDATYSSTYGLNPAVKFDYGRKEENWKNYGDALSTGWFWDTLTSFRKCVISNEPGQGRDISGLRKGNETEVIAGIECEIYEVEDRDGNRGVCTFWVEPTYHFTLKYKDGKDAEYDYTISEYIVPYDGEDPFLAPPGTEFLYG